MDFKLHRTRNTAITNWLRNGSDLHATMKLAGQSPRRSPSATPAISPTTSFASWAPSFYRHLREAICLSPPPAIPSLKWQSPAPQLLKHWGR
jgi:hypothetical protein